MMRIATTAMNSLLLVLLFAAPALCCQDGLFARWLESDPWTMPQACSLQALGIQTGGWLQAGMTYSGEAPSDRSNGPLLTNDRHGELQMNQLWLYFDRPVDTGGYGFDLGGRFDMLYGTDWRVAYFYGIGLEDEINGLDQLYGLALPQFYMEAAWNDLSVKVGRMTGILGYEIVPPMGNFFYSHSYALCYSQPILITGLMGRYKLSDRLTLLGGFHDGFNRFLESNAHINVQGGIMWTAPSNQVSLAYAFDAGKTDLFARQNQYLHSIVFKLQMTERLLYVIQSDLGVATGDELPNAEWYGITQYLNYAINEKWSAGMRVEWFRDDDGVKVLGLGNLPNARGWIGAPGYAGNFTELTLGLNWKPKANVTFRPEVRWDWYDGAANPNGPYPLPFGDGTSREQFTVAADLIVTY